MVTRTDPHVVAVRTRQRLRSLDVAVAVAFDRVGQKPLDRVERCTLKRRRGRLERQSTAAAAAEGRKPSSKRLREVRDGPRPRAGDGTAQLDTGPVPRGQAADSRQAGADTSQQRVALRDRREVAGMGLRKPGLSAFEEPIYSPPPRRGRAFDRPQLLGKEDEHGTRHTPVPQRSDGHAVATQTPAEPLPEADLTQLMPPGSGQIDGDVKGLSSTAHRLGLP